MESVALQVIPKKEPSFYLFKHKDIDGLQLPLKGSSRVKYISFNVSTNYIALGTNAGGIHIFRKSSLRHYRFLNAKVFPQPDSSRIVDVGVTNVLFSNQEKLLAAALSSGYVAIWELNFDKREASQLVKKTDEHKGSTVTNLCWNSSSTKLFIGDSKGCITALELGPGKIRRVHTIIKEGPAIVQLDFADEKLLISNTKKCLYYEQSRDTLVQIGTKPRDGQYGACYLLEANNQAVIYCARPGARLWEVDSSGQVLSTQQYKKLLATSSSPVVGHVSRNEKGLVENCETYNFPKLLVLRDQYLMTWTRERVIIIDPKRGNLILWNNQLENIEDICCNRQEMFVFQTGGCLTRYSLIPPKECAAKLFVMGDWLQCSKVLTSCKTQIIPVTARDHVPEYVVRRVKEMLNDNLEHEEIVRELSELEESLERLPADHASEGPEVPGASSIDDSESRSITSDFLSNPDSDSVCYPTSLDSAMEDNNATSDKKEKLSKLKNVFKDQFKELSLDTVLLAGAQAASHMASSTPFTLGSGANIKSFGSTWEERNSRYNTRSPSDSEGLGDETYSGDSALTTTSQSRNDNAGPSEEADSDAEERKTPIVFKERKKKKIKIHTIDIVSPLQPTDLIKMEKSKATFRSGEDLEKSNIDPPKTVDVQILDTTKPDTDSPLSIDSGVQAQSQESKESIRSRSVAAKQEVVQKARKFLKRLTPEERDLGSEEPTKAFGTKGSGSKGTSTNITSPLEVKSLVIISRETRKKIREKLLYDPRALKATLCDWIIYLEKANVAVDLVYPKNKDTREYYVTDVGKILSPSIKVDLSRFLDPQDTTIVAELTNLCFKMKIFSSSSGNDFQADEELTSEQLLKCGTCKQRQNDVVLNIDSVKVDEELQSVEALKQDLAKTKFLCANFQLLDYQTLRGSVVADCLNHQHLLKNLLRCLDDFTERDAVDDAIDTGDTKEALQLMKDKAENYQKRLLRHVFRLYYLVPRDVAKLCAEIYPHLRPWEVALFCLSTSTNLYSNCSDFLIYVTHLIQSRAKKSEHKLDVLDEISHSEDFIILVYHSALILDDLADSDVRCHCGWPRPGSHQTSFQYEELMIDIIKHFKANNDTEALKKLLNISHNHGYWQGCIKLLVMLGLRIEALKLSFRLGDISLLNSRQIWGWLPKSLSEWKFGLQYLTTFQYYTDGEKMQKDGHNAEMVINDKISHVEKDSSWNDNHNKSSSEVHPVDSEETDENGKTMVESEKECDFEANAEYDEQCGQQSPEVQGFDDKLKSAAPFSDKASLKEDLNSFDQHTCLRSRASAEHRSLFVDLKSYVLLMLQRLGAEQTLKTISDTKLQNIFFTQEFYYKCILSSQLENHKSPLSHRILREINDHMWSSNSTALVPEVYQMKEVEISSSSKEELFNGKEPLKYSRSLEDAACNWGIDLPLAVSFVSQGVQFRELLFDLFSQQTSVTLEGCV